MANKKKKEHDGKKPKPDKRLRHIEIFGDKNKSFDLDDK